MDELSTVIEAQSVFRIYLNDNTQNLTDCIAFLNGAGVIPKKIKVGNYSGDYYEAILDKDNFKRFKIFAKSKGLVIT